MEVLYSAKTGFECCGHLYYNSSLWSCCAGTLRPVPQPGKYLSENITKESILLSLGNLKKTDLCTKLQVGIVESVFLPSIVFNSVVEIHGWNASVTPLPSPHILKTATDSCSNPKLVPGKSYFFDKVKGHVFIDFNHDSILQSIYFIISKCYGNI
ncbi:uncharacterized protein si:ch211-195m9.3 [Pungitius pungitius]|uniref:uncharacterized protein si:ch211-195m9.3 n=1 Tax=Pungitius pungitius TaxID=134920 RepID=UPI002E153A39